MARGGNKRRRESIMTKTDSPMPPKTLGDKSRGTLNNDLLMDLDNITFDLQNTHSTEAKYNRCTQIVKADYWQLRTKPDIEVVTAEHWKKTDFGNLMKIHSLSVAQPDELQEPEVPNMGGRRRHVDITTGGLVVNHKKGISVKVLKKVCRQYGKQQDVNTLCRSSRPRVVRLDPLRHDQLLILA